MKKLSQRDKRALKIGAVCAAAILVFVFATKWFEHWAEVRKSIAEKRAKLEAIRVDKARQEGLLSIVPVFETPQEEEEQMFQFREKFNEQLKKAGIKGEPIRVLRTRRKQHGTNYKLLCLQSRGKCNFEQVLNLLAGLRENPYLVGIEELKMECDPKKRREFKVDLTVSTFIK